MRSVSRVISRMLRRAFSQWHNGSGTARRDRLSPGGERAQFEVFMRNGF